MKPPTRSQRGLVEEALLLCWDDGNAMGLDGWAGPERGEEPDQHAIEARRRCVDRALADIPSIDDARTHTCAPGQLRRKFDGGRNAILCAQCDTLLGYDPGPSHAERSTGPMDRDGLIERAARLLAETRDMAWDFEPGLSDDPYMRDARVLADAGLLCDMTPIQLGQTRLTGRSRDGEW